jgi:hypothetical protein
MGQVIDIIDQVDDGRHKERNDDPWGIMVHRCGVDLQTGVVFGYHGKAVADAFLGRVPAWLDAARATGYQNAYTVLFGGDLGPAEFDGAAWQCLPLDEIGPHGRRFSPGFLGLGLIADPREKPISHRQRAALVDVCAVLCDGYGWDPTKRILGHGEVKGSHSGTKAPGRPAACPGDLLDMDALRFEIRAMMTHHRRSRLAQEMVFTRGA